MIDSVAQDVRQAVRTLVRRPGFAAAAVATLALGIGASTAIFSVAYGVTLRPLPYPQPDRLVRVYESNRATNAPRENVTIGTFHEWRESETPGTPRTHGNAANRNFSFSSRRIADRG